MLLSEHRFLPYLLATAGFLILIWILTHQISEAPVVVVNGNTRTEAGWTAVSDKDRTFAINLPKEWLTEEDVIVDYGAINTAVFTVMDQFSQSDPNLTIQTVAYSDEKDDNEPVMALLLFQSERLNGIDVEELATFIAKNENQFQKTTIIERPWHIPQLHLLTDNSDRSIDYVCELRYAPSKRENAFFVTLCAARTSYTINRNNISKIMNSFQEIN